MVTPKLEDLLANAAASDGPDFPPETSSRLGGVDPLGLRQLNFNIMDELLPGVNNVAKHVRPFVVIAWAWRRAGWSVGTASGLQIDSCGHPCGLRRSHRGDLCVVAAD